MVTPALLLLSSSLVSRLNPGNSSCGGDVTQVGVGEEGPDQARHFLQPAQHADGLGLEIVFAGDAGLADPVVLGVLPDSFVGVQLG